MGRDDSLCINSLLKYFLARFGGVKKKKKKSSFTPCKLGNYSSTLAPASFSISFPMKFYFPIHGNVIKLSQVPHL